ncbi:MULTISPECIES: hypothetical protein [unclassified Rhizobium]|uniref:hypothetical protein n=1 Tax=unclassified Rhizobium TaxID=2613769 RepID=UPI001ADBAE14|nr:MULTISPECIES: hypothetical protein [unclassified Rhizobium]MBO9099097.1 hypothetical protein [Rhizobium sp. L58/93]MBO9132096.1 hypothetical protein [Rhizobium sp. B209b/85]MBO9169360.1 hypothetical protein [Rhizobium sp. L245/93]MBO9185312.1 hypothetical protein [Rhizobium sp. E27B/91]QXZ85452.1 hypothetical protein J5287_08080 [Rhizobium sp. K1/93]
MAHGHFPERDIAQLRRLLDDACKGIAAAEAALAHHSRPEARLTAINFPLEETLLGEAVGLWSEWRDRVAALLRQLDTQTAAALLQYERLFDETAGRQSQGFLRRRVHLGNAAPEAIALDVVELLSVSAALDRMLGEAKPFLALHHRVCEAHLQQLVTRRRQLDGELDEAGRRLSSLKARTHERASATLPQRGPSLDAISEEERKELALDRQAAEVKDKMLRSEHETLLRLMTDDEDFLDVLNSGIAAVNVMAAKLAIDVEQRVALLKAANEQSATQGEDLPAGVEDLVAAFEANLLAGHDMLLRKQAADEAFARRLEVAPSPREPAVDDEEDVPAAPQQQPATI